jgi:hypothetical protein
MDSVSFPTGLVCDAFCVAGCVASSVKLINDELENMAGNHRDLIEVLYRHLL